MIIGNVNAEADQRNYVWTIEYSTLATGNAEIEFYQTAVTRDIQTRNASDWAGIRFFGSVNGQLVSSLSAAGGQLAAHLCRIQLRA